MNKEKFFMLVFAVVLVPSLACSQVVINEFAYDDFDPDDLEFVELYNAGTAAVDISGYKITNGYSTEHHSYTVPASTTLAAGDYYVIGHAGIPNVDQVEASFVLENGSAYLALEDSSSNVLDSVIYERNAGGGIAYPAGYGEPASDGSAGTAGGIWGHISTRESDETQGNGFDFDGDPNASMTAVRYVDGYDTDNNNLDFGKAIASPGLPNNFYGTVNLSSAYSNNFDGTEDTIVTDIVGSAPGGIRIQDPTVADSQDSGRNPAAIAASPQGGNCLIIHRAWSNGAIANLDAPVADVSVEAYVYLDSTQLTGANNYFNLVPMLVRGTVDCPYGSLGSGSDGTQGICWFFQNNFNESGTMTMVLEEVSEATQVQQFGSVTIDSSNDGWQRMYLEVDGANITGVFGGTLGTGTSTGTVFTGTTTLTRAGGICFAARDRNPSWESVLPIRLDALQITDLSASTAVDDWLQY